MKRETFEKLHEKPVHKMTRRELLGAGLIQFSAAITLPSVLSLLAKSGVAQAADLVCPDAGASSLPPFMTLTLAGGAGLSANFVPHDQGLQPLQSYNRLGLGAAGSFSISTEFKNSAPFAGISQILAGIRLRASATTLQNTVFVGIPNRSQDDSTANKQNMDGLVIKAGRLGEILPTLGSNRNQAALVTPPNPLPVSNFQNISDALGVKNSLASLSSNQQSGLFNLIQKLTGHQAAKLIGLSGGAELSSLVQCAAADNVQLIQTTDPGVNPLGHMGVATLWGLTANNMNSQQFTMASIVFNVAKGHAPTGNITLGGYDYHNNTRATGDTRDLEAGEVIGRILETYALMGKKGYLVVTSDGSVTSPISDVAGGPWVTDRGSAGMLYIFAFDPTGATSASSFQVGHFLPGVDQQAADASFITGGSPEIAGAAAVANYLSFAGKANLIEFAMPRIFTATDLPKILKISA